ncbi:hypothetical protein [Paludibacterium purpuratum]|uniref:VCBS repeat-containing protein n=1 Tax=Paludibacterium purpuratum TaxID=1144873 RepID=A0A4R7B9D0_9NEIS|nr:hypothetical protein [Paludibacterium purpuratum]TDR81474.1 hypothetical protein DFP86_103127 [Paludibacterium purpuratum]
MQIRSFTLDMGSSHLLRQQQSSRTQFTPRTSTAAATDRQTDTVDLQSATDTLDLNSATGQAALHTATRTLSHSQTESQTGAVNLPKPGRTVSANEPAATAQPLSEQDLPPLLSLAKQILEKVLGIHFTLYNGKLVPDDGSSAPSTSAGTPAPAADKSGTQTTSSQYREQEQTDFSANGSITTADGQTISFQLDSRLQRDYQTSSTVTRQVGASGSVDPLMITLPDGNGRFSGASVSFDLQNNGSQVSLPFVSGGGWLVWDKRHDGKVSDGSQLFGPQSGNGFGDLAQLDSNHDGVIDSSDAAYADLKVWTGVDAKGNAQLATLSSLHIGAILLPSVATPFSLRDGGNREQGEVKRSGVYLTEDGQAGRISQVDIAA